MNRWNNVPISFFLEERKDRYSPEQANLLGLRRLEKINFSGQIHCADSRNTHTNMILVKKGDLVISGINVEKGAIAVYNGEEDVLATIHYSSYSFDENQIDIGYFKWFLKSRIFKDIVNLGIRGGIKTELKPKPFLSLIIPLPTLDAQILIRKKLDSVVGEIEELKKLDSKNEDYIQKLRQAILEEAVSGKLVPQDPNDEPASELLKKIKAEKERLISEKRIRKREKLSLISEEEMPYAIPEGWEWARVGDIACVETGATPESTNSSYYGGKIPWITSSSTNNPFITSSDDFITEKALEKTNCKVFPKNTLIVAMYGQGKTRGQISELLIEAATNQACAALVFDNSSIGCKDYVKIIFRKIYDSLRASASGGAQPNLNLMKIKMTLIPLPPLSEQRRIVQKVDQLMLLCNELEEKVKENQENSGFLMEAVLKEAFAS